MLFNPLQATRLRDLIINSNAKIVISLDHLLLWTRMVYVEDVNKEIV